jgi:transposase InsO family protein
MMMAGTQAGRRHPSRKVRKILDTTLHADFCVEALEEALSVYGKPEIFNTDQGSQFTSDEFT